MPYLTGKINFEKKQITEFSGPLKVDIQKLEEKLFQNDGSKSTCFQINGKTYFLEIEQNNFFLFTHPNLEEYFENKSKIKFLEKLMKNSHDMFAVIDEDGIEKYINEAVYRITGFSKEEVIGKNGFQFIHPEDLEYLLEKLEEYRERYGEFIKVEYRHLHKEGNWLYLEAIAQNFLNDPILNGITMNIRDVTENKILQQQLLKKEKLASLGKLASGIAHDFNNQLSIILGYCELLKKNSFLDETQIKYIENIEHSARVAVSFIKELLTTARKGIAKKEILNIHDLINHLKIIGTHTLEKTIKLLTEFRATDIHIKADKDQLESAFFNIIVNAKDAIKTHHTTGWIKIKTSNVFLKGNEFGEKVKLSPGDYVKIEFLNSGPKIEREILNKIFQPFFTTKKTGTGMGLYSVYISAKENNGFIFYEDDKEWPIFSFYFPVAQLDERNTSKVQILERETQINKLQLEKKKIFLLDDEELIVEMIKDFLSAQQLEIEYTSSPKKAREIISKKQFDIIILDYNLPEITGTNLLKEINIPQGQNILFISGQKVPEKDIEPLSQFNIKILQKPFQLEELLFTLSDFFCNLD